MLTRGCRDSHNCGCRDVGCDRGNVQRGKRTHLSTKIRSIPVLELGAATLRCEPTPREMAPQVEFGDGGGGDD